MGNAQIPRRAKMIDIEVGYRDDGALLELSLYRHTRPGHEHPMFWAVWAVRDARGRIIERETRQITGKNAETTALAEMAESRKILLQSRADVDRRRAAWRENATLRRVSSAAGRFLAETPEGGQHPEPTDETIAARMADTIRPISPGLYPAVRREITWQLTGK